MTDNKLLTYSFKETEEYYNANWDFSFQENSLKKKYFVLSMFPYPSGKLHMGHIRNYTIGDVIARYKRGKGFNVLHPIGWDAFGLPAENAALENNVHPDEWTEHNINNMKKQLKKFGFSYDWHREITTCNHDYYKHEQEMFIKMYNKGLCYRKKSQVNWDPIDKTVLANEQVINGKGWRSGATVEKKNLNQWFIKITNYAEELLSGLSNLDGWPEKVKKMQEQWIGKSSGVEIDFVVVGSNYKITTFTTRPETIFGASFCALNLEHSLIEECKKHDNYIQDFIDKMINVGDDNILLGYKTNIKVYHPLDKTIQLPVYLTNYVVNYGTKALFACPAHDERDYNFAIKYGLPIKKVILSEDDLPFVSKKGIMCNSDFLDGLTCEEASNKIVGKIIDLNIGRKKINYKLHDWGVSRQRYWGCPIPMVHCDGCGIVTVSLSELPITLPKDVVFDGQGNPLENHMNWKKTTCPKCHGDAVRDTDTFDTFFESSWYFLAFCNVNYNLNAQNITKIMPVDFYIGGIEHAVMHLLYARFFTKALSDCGYFDIKEPFGKLLTQGMVCHQTFKSKEGKWLYPEEAQSMSKESFDIGNSEKMSKSKKNLVDPESMIKKYGVDAVRLFILSDNPPESDMEWTDQGLSNINKFVNRIYRLVLNFVNNNDLKSFDNYSTDLISRSKLHKILSDINHNLENTLLNKVVANFYEIFNLINSVKDTKIIFEAINIFVRVIEPFMPFLAEKLWHLMYQKNNFIHNEPWPKVDEKMLTSNQVTFALQINGKTRKTLNIAIDTTKDLVIANASKILEKYLTNKQIVKVIFIPNKILNFVVK